MPCWPFHNLEGFQISILSQVDQTLPYPGRYPDQSLLSNSTLQSNQNYKALVRMKNWLQDLQMHKIGKSVYLIRQSPTTVVTVHYVRIGKN